MPADGAKAEAVALEDVGELMFGPSWLCGEAGEPAEGAAEAEGPGLCMLLACDRGWDDGLVDAVMVQAGRRKVVLDSEPSGDAGGEGVVM